MKRAHSYEVEVKSLLGSSERAEELRKALKRVDGSSKLVSRNKQLNHYFVGGNLHELVKIIVPEFPADTAAKFVDLAERTKNYSVRTRDKDGKVYLVIKASVDETTSENGIARIEFEEEMHSMSLEDVDRLVQLAGFSYQAKWSREREEYTCLGINVTLDKNAGYGWLAEFEKILDNEADIPDAKEEIAELMSKLGVQELQQDRLGRMFDFYNKNWPEYYGTEKIFTVE